MRKPTFLFSPGGLVLNSCFRGSESTGYGASGFLRSDGGLPPEFSRFFVILFARRFWNFGSWPSLDASAERFGAGEEKAGKDFHRPKIVHWPLKEDKISPVSALRQ